jgi:16S rRNA (guanine1516-N2)-methyltransferase
MHLVEGQALIYLQQALEPKPDVVYIDPMFPASKKAALVKKDMQAFHQVVGADSDSDELLAAALAACEHRVVVKRPKKAPSLADTPPNFTIEGKAIRFDVYSLKAFNKT